MDLKKSVSRSLQSALVGFAKISGRSSNKARAKKGVPQIHRNVDPEAIMDAILNCPLLCPITNIPINLSLGVLNPADLCDELPSDYYPSCDRERCDKGYGFYWENGVRKNNVRITLRKGNILRQDRPSDWTTTAVDNPYQPSEYLSIQENNELIKKNNSIVNYIKNIPHIMKKIPSSGSYDLADFYETVDVVIEKVPTIIDLDLLYRIKKKFVEGTAVVDTQITKMESFDQLTSKINDLVKGQGYDSFESFISLYQEKNGVTSNIQPKSKNCTETKSKLAGRRRKIISPDLKRKARLLLLSGISGADVCRRLDISDTTITRYRQELRNEGLFPQTNSVNQFSSFPTEQNPVSA